MRRNLFIPAVCASLYCLNRLWLGKLISGGTGWFLTCYFSDILAGLFLPSIVSLLLLAARRPPMEQWRFIALLLLGAGLVWECLAPLWKVGAVFDWWDFAAYQLGGLLYHLFHNCIHRRKNTGNQ